MLATELKRSSNTKGLLQCGFECLCNSLNVPAEPVSSCPRAAKYQYQPTVGHGQGVRDIGERLSTSVSEVAQAQEATGKAGCVYLNVVLQAALLCRVGGCDLQSNSPDRPTNISNPFEPVINAAHDATTKPSCHREGQMRGIFQPTHSSAQSTKACTCQADEAAIAAGCMCASCHIYKDPAGTQDLGSGCIH
jgi:hypothetical protein